MEEIDRGGGGFSEAKRAATPTRKGTPSNWRRGVMAFLTVLAANSLVITAWVPAPLFARTEFHARDCRSSTLRELHNTPTAAAPNKRTNRKARSSARCSTALSSIMDGNNVDLPGPAIVVIVALGLGIAAQGWINTMLKGDDGLGAFLKDGRGYRGSAYRSSSGKKVSEDPLPWLSLPKLDFVEVAGQDKGPALVEQELEQLRLEMTKELQAGNVEEATVLRNKLEQLCTENGFEYNADS